MNKTALIFCSELARFSYGDDHPFKPLRYKLAFDLMTSYGLTSQPFVTLSDFPLLSDADLLSFHSPQYIARLREFSDSCLPRADFRYGLGDVENPVFPGVFDCALRGASGTAAAARMIADEGYDAVFHLAGGWHHAHRARASGFSYLNDAVIAINHLVDRGMRVAYLDIDAHHGDGVQEGFYDTDRVLTISLHQSGTYFFPGTGFEHEIGTGAGKGYAVNIPFLEHADDSLFIRAFEDVTLPVLEAFSPDVVVTQLGADTFCTDPLSLLEFTTHGYTHVLAAVKALGVPWVAVAGGGYNNFNVARAWTLAWGIMNDEDLAPNLPESFRMEGVPYRMLHDPPHCPDDELWQRAADALDRTIATLRRTILPLHGRTP